MDQETAYLALLQSADTYEVEGDVLRLLSGGSAVLSYQAIPSELEDAFWRLSTLATPSGPTGPLPGTSVFLVIDEAESQAFGTGGCNRYTAGFTASDTEISIGPVASTQMFCAEPEGVMDQEALYLGLLESATGYELGDDLLTLRNADGVVLEFVPALRG